MSIVYKYEIYCETEAQNVYTWGEAEPTKCPNNDDHTIDTESISIVETAGEDEVALTNVATIDDVVNDPLRVVVAPGHAGYYMCDRDILIKTGLVADTFEDVKVNVSTSERVDWGEISFLGCYKESEGTEPYELCEDQEDANSNAVLSIWEYAANNQQESPSPVEIEFKGGSLWVDESVSDSWEHQIFAVLAPDIPVAYGGCIRFFDGYLYPFKGVHMETVNTLAMKVDPSQSAYAAKLRVWLFYPAGTQNEHVLRLVTFRNTF